MGGGGAPGFRGTPLPSTPGPRNFLAPGAPRFQRLWIPGALPVSEDSRSSGIPASEDCESPRLPVCRDSESPGHLPSDYTSPGLPGALLLASTPSPRGLCCLRDLWRTAAPRLLSPCSRQDAEPPPLPPPFPPRAAAGAARPVAEPCPAVPARAALPALPAGAPGPSHLRYGRGWRGRASPRQGTHTLSLHPCQRPVFTHAWVPEMRAIEVWVPAGPALMVRLCHQLALECEELPWPFHQQVLVPGGHHISLPYEFLVPCLCIEASYSHHDSPRRKHCPFRDRPDAYGPELWSSVRFHDYSTSSKDQMAMMLNASCPLHPRATLCWRETADEAAPCHDIPNSTASEDERWVGIGVYILDKVDVHPQLCFRFSYKNSSHVECPHQPETAWNVSVSVWGFQLRLHLTSRIPAAFSAALAGPGQLCAGKVTLVLSSVLWESQHGPPLTQPLLQVWRSDVHFARKQLLCPDGERGSWRGTQGDMELSCHCCPLHPAGVPGGRPVLLLYSPDSEEHLGLVCALAERLRAGLGCDVRLDLWEAGGLGQTGALPWLYAQRSRVGRQRGTVLLLWSRGSARLFHRWQVGMADGTPGDAHDIFGAAMACLHGELGAAGRGGGWVLAYFSRLCSPRDVPRPLRPLPTYRLPRQLPGLLGALRGSPPAPRRCYRGRAGGLLHRLLEVGTGEGSRCGNSRP
uniref:Interleukin 17 receptor E n=1 Tax=Catharus ustulatus TaxID=91951 RepID=A0A8C3VCY2_CATUS